MNHRRLLLSLSLAFFLALRASAQCPNLDVTTIAGSPGATDNVDGVGAAARFTSPTSVAVDSNGNVYVAERDGHRIRKITPATSRRWREACRAMPTATSM